MHTKPAIAAALETICTADKVSPLFPDPRLVPQWLQNQTGLRAKVPRTLIEKTKNVSRRAYEVPTLYA